MFRLRIGTTPATMDDTVPHPPPGATPHAIVIGSGMAGLSAAMELAERGIAVTLLERGDCVGGKVRGWHDAAGASLECGLHGFFADFTNAHDLLQRVGLASHLVPQPGPTLVVHRGGPHDRLTFSKLPSPLHALGMLRGVHTLGLRGKLSTLRAGLAAASFDPVTQYEELDAVDFRSWLRAKGVSQAATCSVFEPLIRSSLFLPLEQASAAAALNVLAQGIRHRGSWRQSWLGGNTGDYLCGPIAARLERLGGVVRIKTEATDIVLRDGRAVAVRTRAGDERLDVPCDYVVLAVDIESCKTLVRGALNALPAFNQLFNLTTTDVLVTRTWFQGIDRLRHGDGLFVGFRLVDAFVDVTRIQPELARPNLCVVETQSRIGKRWIRAPESVIRELVLRDLAEAFPELERARVEKHVVLRHPGLFSALSVASNQFRPPVVSPLPNLFLAGDWVRSSGTPVLLENAVVTGRLAAAQILSREGRPTPIVLAPERAEWPVRVVAAAGRAMRGVERGLERAVDYQPIGSASPHRVPARPTTGG